MKKIIVAIAACLIAVTSVYARGPGGCPGGGFVGPGGMRPGCHPGWGPGPGHYHHHHNSWWGRGGRNFWPGFVGGLVGGALSSGYYGGVHYVGTTTYVAPEVVPGVTYAQPVTTVVTPTVVQSTPVVVRQLEPVVTTTTAVSTRAPVWVEGHYVNQVQPNGTVVRVWYPGHYE